MATQGEASLAKESKVHRAAITCIGRAGAQDIWTGSIDKTVVIWDRVRSCAALTQWPAATDPELYG